MELSNTTRYAKNLANLIMIESKQSLKEYAWCKNDAINLALGRVNYAFIHVSYLLSNVIIFHLLCVE